MGHKRKTGPTAQPDPRAGPKEEEAQFAQEPMARINGQARVL